MSAAIDFTESTCNQSLLTGRAIIDRPNRHQRASVDEEDRSRHPDASSATGLHLAGTFMLIAACAATLAFGAWVVVDGLRAFADQITSLSPTQLLQAMAGI